jgi:uroporphyrinogen III methyltransferase/synthase
VHWLTINRIVAGTYVPTILIFENFGIFLFSQKIRAEQVMSQGKVFLIGAGPGDVELITLKGYRLICQADVILYDHLIPTELLKLAKLGAEMISVGKFAGRHTLPQLEINKLLVKKAKDNNLVVRLKGGDPYVFGRGGEEVEACVDAKIEFEVVPGVTSAFAAPCYAGIPPTHRDFTPHVAVVTGHRKEEKQIEIPKAGTVVFLMGVANLPKIIRSLLDAGWLAQTNIAAVENGTRYNQRVITGTLGNFVEKTQAENLHPPAIFIVGRVVELRRRLNWFAKKPNILVLGLHPQKYSHLGNIVHRPIIDCVRLDDYSQADPVLQELDRFDWIVFTSANGVKFLFERLNEIALDTRTLASAKVAAIGPTSAAKLEAFGILADMQPQIESSEGLLDAFRSVETKDKKILLVRPKVGPSRLMDGLADMGAAVEAVVMYKNVDLDPGDIDFEFIDQILFTSGSTVRAFLKRYGSVQAGIKVYCLGQPTLDEAMKHSITAERLPSDPV